MRFNLAIRGSGIFPVGFSLKIIPTRTTVLMKRKTLSPDFPPEFV
jgi:hypothetical protein